MKINLAITAVVLLFMYIIIDIVKGQYNRIVVSQPEYNHIVKIDTCRIVTDTLGKPFCIWYHNKLYLPDPYQDLDQETLKKQ
jgi:hypothetical protein